MSARPAPHCLFTLHPLSVAARLALTACLGGAALAHAQTATLPPVTVTSSQDDVLPGTQRGGQVARGARLGLLGNADTMNAPFSINSFTASAIANQQAVTAADVVTRDSAVRTTSQTGSIFDSFYIRGFAIGEGNLGELAFDGFYGVAPNYRVLSDYVERVEVLKGPGALLYGMSPNSGVGGVINIVPKRAGPKDATSLTLDYVGGQKGAQVDLSRRLGAERNWGIRVNASRRAGDTPVDQQERAANVGAVALDYTGERLRATLDLLSQDERFDAPSRPFLLAAGVPLPSAPPGERNVTQNWEWSKVQDRSALARAEYEVADRTVLFAGVGKGHTKVDRVFGTPTIQNTAGAVSSTPQHFRFDIERDSTEAGLRTRFSTAAIAHTLSLQASRYSDTLSRGSVNGTAYTSNIYSPMAAPAQSIAAPGTVPRLSDTDLSGWALADTLSAWEGLVQLTAGARRQTIQSHNYSPTTGAATSSYSKSAITPLLGLVVRPWKQVAFYANHIQGLSKGDIAPAAASNAGEVFAPYRARQNELGIKVEQNGLIATASVYQITKPSGQLTGTTYAVDAEQRNRGLEFNLTGEASSHVRILAGLTFLDAELTRTNNAATRGKRPIGVPTHQANFGVEWDQSWLTGLTLTGAVSHTGKQFVDATNTRELPAWNKVDLGARYTTKVAGLSSTFRVNVLNAFNRSYWAGVASWGGLVQGAPRTVMVSATVDL